MSFSFNDESENIRKRRPLEKRRVVVDGLVDLGIVKTKKQAVQLVSIALFVIIGLLLVRIIVQLTPSSIQSDTLTPAQLYEIDQVGSEAEDLE